MKFLVLLGLVGCAVAQGGKQDKFAGKYVFDLLKPPLSFSEVQAILASRDANQYPTYNTIPQTSFDCSSKAQPGFYADVDTQCQVFHRCEQSGNRTDYLCPNTTVFNQITLICDAFYNVDCSRSIELEDFANSRLYTNLPLFDTPPADYIAPYQKIVAGSGAMQTQSQTQQAPKRTGSMNIQSGSSQRGGGRPAAATTHAAQSAGRSDDNSGSGDQSSGASGDQSSAASGDQQTGGQTGAMDQQGGAPAAAASGNAQSGGSGAGDQSGGSSAGQGAGDQSSGSGAGQGAGDQSGGSGAGQGAGDQSGGSGAGQSAGDQSTTPSS